MSAPDAKECSEVDIATLAPGLIRDGSGLWFAPSTASISYPPTGNAAVRAIEDDSFWFRHRNRCIVNVVRRFTSCDVFLDIGGGNGYVAKGLSDAGVPCVLIEPGRDGALSAQARGVGPIICARLEDATLRSNCIPAAGMFDVLEHIEDEAEALRQVHRVLQPGGHFFLTVPAYQGLFSADDVIAGHFRRYSLSRLVSALQGCGFRTQFASYIFTPLPPFIFLFRAIPTRLRIRRTDDISRSLSAHAPKGFVARVMDRLLDFELRSLKAGRSLPFGASCLCVAVKP